MQVASKPAEMFVLAKLALVGHVLFDKFARHWGRTYSSDQRRSYYAYSLKVSQPMRSRMICYVAGITTIVWLPTLPPLWMGVIPLILIAFYRKLPALLICFLVGFLWSFIWCHWQMAHRFQSVPLKSDWHVSGQVVGLPQYQGGDVRFLLQPERLTASVDGVLLSHSPRLLRLNWYRPDQVVRPGMVLELEVRLKPPHGFSNPGGFDYELWLMAQGIDATGYVRAVLSVTEMSDWSFVGMRLALSDFIQARYTSGQVSALVKAIVLGVRDGFSEAQWQQLRATGTIHLAVISGLHIGFIVVLVLAMVRGLSYIINPGYLRAGGVWLTIAVAFIYMQLAGAGLPTQRAFVMVSVFLLAQWRLWYVDLWSRWWFAMALVLALSPIATHQAGFWLSFLAVATLLWFSGHRVRDLLGWRVQFAIFFAMMPVLVWLFGGFSVVAPLINLIAIPLIALCLSAVAVDLLLSAVGVDLFIPLVDWGISFFWWLVGVAAEWQNDIWRVPDSSILSVSIALAGSLLMLQPRGFPLRRLGIVLWLPLLFGVQSAPVSDGYHVWVFDVGQGTAVLIQVGDKTLLYDAGPAYPGGASAFRHTLAPYLERRGIQALDMLVLSHDDLDHTGGHAALLDQVSVSGGTTGSEALSERYGYRVCRSGDQWQWQDVRFTVLSGGNQALSDNNSSCVIRVDDGHCSMLLTGDIDSEIERGLLAEDKPLSWLIAAHHGSKTATRREFLARWRPDVVVFSAGYASRFGHPSADVVQRVIESGAQPVSTAQSGAVHLISGLDNHCAAEGWRHTKRRFWSGY